MTEVKTESKMAGYFRLWRRIWSDDIFRVIRHPAILLFSSLWIVSVIYLAATGYQGFVKIALTTAGTMLVLTLITVLIMDNKDWTPPHRREAPESRIWLCGQVVFLGIILLFTLVSSFYYQKVAGPNSFAAVIGRPLEGFPNAIRNPLLLGALPLIGLLLLRARFKNLGLSSGKFLWILTVVWCAVPAFQIMRNVLTGSLMLSTLGTLLLLNLFQNGFYEEFLLRGALQTRLALLLDPTWAIVLQALAFGVWHLALGFVVIGSGNIPGSNLLAALAVNITFHAVSGMGYGFLFWRSGNIIAPSIFHILNNTAGV